MARLRRRIAAAVAVAGALVGCSGPGTKAGGQAELITLRLAAIDSEGAPYTEGLAEFVRQVADRSGGAIHVEITWETAKREFGESGPRGDQQVAGLVQNRTYELGLIPARAWDMLNVTSLRALQAPFLIDSDELMDTVATSELVEPMLRSLSKAGVVGLALIPDGLRHPVGFTKPFLSMRDFAGTRFRVLPSDTTNQLIRALGAEPVNLRDSEFADGLSNGSIAGAESAFGWAIFLPRQGVFTANVTLYARFNVLIANDEVFQRLAERDRTIVSQAAASTLQYVLKTRRSDHDLGTQYCPTRGEIAIASAADIAAMEQATAPVTATLEQDPETRSQIERIRTIKATVPQPIPIAPCKKPDRPTSSTVADVRFPDGVYRTELPPDPIYDPGMVGINTLTFRDGHLQHEDSNHAICEGVYRVSGDRVAVYVTNSRQCGASPGAQVFSARWKLEHDQLTFLDVTSETDGDEVARKLWGRTTWQKIG